jgi:5'-nucleotidase / UDP-sugar diphosphatase
LVLDAGNTLTGRWLTQKTQGAIMVEAMNMMAYDAMVVGQTEMSLGLEQLKKLAGEAKFPFLSANIVSTANKEAIFKPYTILERGGKKIAIIGISDLQAAEAPGMSGQVSVLDPVQTAQKVVGEVQSQADLVVVLSRLGLEADNALARAVPGIDIIVGGNTRKIMAQPERAGDTLIIQQGYLGEWVGALDVAYVQGKPVRAEARVLSLTPDFQNDPEMATLVAKYAQLYPTPTQTPLMGLADATPTPAK